MMCLNVGNKTARKDGQAYVRVRDRKEQRKDSKGRREGAENLWKI